MERQVDLIEPYDLSDRHEAIDRKFKRVVRNDYGKPLDSNPQNSLPRNGYVKPEGNSTDSVHAGKAYTPPSMPRFELDRVKDSLLTYLGSSPAKLARPGVSWDDPEAIGELLLNLGKCLQWLSPQVDGKNRPEVISQPEEGKQSVFELGAQFRILGLRYLDAQKRADQYSAQEVRRRLIGIENHLAANCHGCRRNGGGK